jgi:hypothetical protein
LHWRCTASRRSGRHRARPGDDPTVTRTTEELLRLVPPRTSAGPRSASAIPAWRASVFIISAPRSRHRHGYHAP